MSIIPQVASAMQTVLTDVADSAGESTGFIQRRRKLTGSSFVQTVVFSWLANSCATYSEMSQTAATLGVDLSPQAIEARFTQQAALTLKAVLDAGVEQIIKSEPPAIPLLERFNGVYLDDSSWIQLPNELADCFAGCGGSTDESARATVKLHLRWNIRDGKIDHLSLTDGRTNDKSSTIDSYLKPLPVGSMRIADLGYFAISTLKQFSDEGVFWLTKLQANTLVFDTDGDCMDLPDWVSSQHPSEFEHQVLIGAQARLPCRLVVQRVSRREARRRRREIKKQARSKGHPPSQARLKLAGYNICLTNAPPSMLSVAEAMVLYRVRWQIELIFKLFKNHGEIDTWQSEKKWWILCEIYGKLIALLIEHWFLLCGGIICPYHSMTKAAKAVAKHALSIAAALATGCKQRLIEALETMAPSILAGTRIYKRNNPKSTYQQLKDVTNSRLTQVVTSHQIFI